VNGRELTAEDVKNWAPNNGCDDGSRLMAAWLDR